jgi:hypothetical protein
MKASIERRISAAELSSQLQGPKRSFCTVAARSNPERFWSRRHRFRAANWRREFGCLGSLGCSCRVTAAVGCEMQGRQRLG